MSDAHKAALEAGRREGRIVRQYLDALEATQPRPGRKRTPESITKRLAGIDKELSGAKSWDRLHLLQERQNLVAELTRLSGSTHLAELEDAFVAVARSYSERKAISYATWRDVGVSAATLARAGVGRV